MKKKREPKDVVVNGSVRFSCIDAHVVRLEYDPLGVFEDRPTSWIATRQKCEEWQSVEELESGLILSTGIIGLECTNSSNPFSSDTLAITFNLNGKNVNWRPGDIDPENLGGIPPSMDRVSKAMLPYPVESQLYDPMADPNEQVVSWALLNSKIMDLGVPFPQSLTEIIHYLRHGKFNDLEKGPDGFEDMLERARRYPPGYLSKSGFTVLNDSGSPIMTGKQFEHLPRRQGIQDLYFIAYGSNYKAGLKRVRDLSGPAPMIPRYAFGFWFSEYDERGEEDYRNLIDDCRKHGIPLDVIVMDLYWHDQKTIYPPRVNAWYGWEWNEELFPDPARFTRWVHGEGLHLSANVHPGGIPKTDHRYPDFERRFGQAFLPTNDSDSKKRGSVFIDWEDCPQVRAYFEELHRPVNEDGLDIWWVDGSSNIGQAEANRHYFEFTENVFPKQRPITLVRHGMHSGHRYPVVFTGDSHADWEVLREEIRYTAQGANVLQSYLSHEIAGHLDQIPVDLYVRWSQFGALSPIFRYHGAFVERRPWKFGEEALQAVKEALHLRYKLIPYLYTLSREAYDSGVAMCRPMYLEFPGDQTCYEFLHQFMLGNRLLVAPVDDPKSVKKIYFPEGEWYHYQTGEKFQGPQVISKTFPLRSIPLYVRGGKILPKGPYADRIVDIDPNIIEISIWGEGKDEYRVYQDDGYTPKYKQANFRFIPIKYSTNATGAELAILPEIDDFEADSVRLSATIHDFPSVAEIIVNGNRLTPNPSGEPGYSYNAANRILNIRLGRPPLSMKFMIEIIKGPDESPA